MSYRVLLPSDVEPISYDLTLEPDLERFTFDGAVNIDCDVIVATEEISLHAKELLISEAKFTPCEGGEKTFDVTEIRMKMKETVVTLAFSEILPVGKGVLSIKFRGSLNDQMAGFYRSKYKDSKGIERHMATTQFEAIDARRCFPCWDEPARKAIFVVTLVYDGKLTALSNMPPSRLQTLADGRRKESFMPTPKMSTYLLAFCIGEFEFISAQCADGTLARVFCTPGNLWKCSYALKCTTKALDFYNEFFKVAYPLPKIDMIAIPDFSAGAMENWGLVTYREVALLCDEKTVSSTQKQRICSVITHELAHQWFGNLVTMQWWDDLWLNEGFACWMQTFAADHIHPEWNIWETFVSSDQQMALSLDSLRSSHPIQVPIAKAEEVEEVFDHISYCKGGSVVRMIFAVLGAGDFQKGLRIYFDKHKYGNTETTDLWKAWTEASGKPVDKMMKSWTEQMGYPVLKIIADPAEAGDGTEVEIEQGWFLADGSSQAGDAEKTWFVPVLSGTEKGASSVQFLEPSPKKAKIKGDFQAKNASWLKLNFGQHIPVRVLYPPSMLTKLIGSLKSLPVEDRIGLLSDSLALCKAGLLNPVELVKLLDGFQGEANDKVWSVLATALSALDKIISQGLDAATYTAFLAFASKLVSPAFKMVGWDAAPTDDDNRKKLRSSLVSLSSKFCANDASVVAEAKRRAEAFLEAPSDGNVLSPDIRDAVLSLSVQNGDKQYFERVQKAHAETTDAAVRISIYRGLGDAKGTDLQNAALEWCLTDAVRSQDLIYIPMVVASSGKDGANAVFAWVQSSYGRIDERIGKTSMMLFMNVVKISGNGFASTDKASEFENFWKGTSHYKAIAKAVTQTVETIHNSAKFLEILSKSDVAKPSGWP